MNGSLKDPDTLVDIVKIEPHDMGNPLVFSIPDGWPRVLEEVRMLIDEGVDGDAIMISRGRMTVGDFAMLPEHSGW